MYQNLELYIDGAWSPASANGVRQVFDPATEDALGTIQDATPADLDRALAAAEKGFETWRRTGTWERAAMIRKVADLIRDADLLPDVQRASALMLGGPQANIAGLVGRWVGAGERFRNV